MKKLFIITAIVVLFTFWYANYKITHRVNLENSFSIPSAYPVTPESLFSVPSTIEQVQTPPEGYIPPATTIPDGKW